METQAVESGMSRVTDAGIASLPQQIRRRAQRQAFPLNLMVVGEAGLGKSTLINAMFLADIYRSQGIRPEKTVSVTPHHVELQEGGVTLSLTVIDTPGFGDVINNSSCWSPITGYLEHQFADFLEAETRVGRGVERMDRRVHGLLYFLPPTGHGVRAMDIETMKRLHDKVNLVPVIGKADAFTPEELREFKHKIGAQLAAAGIQVFSFPGEEGAGPWAVVGSNTVVEVQGERRWGRSYPWGVVNIEDPLHCDFSPLRSLLLAHHTLHLVHTTHTHHYENFRCKELSSLAAIDDSKSTIPNKNPLAVIEDETKVHMVKVRKMEEEMEEVFRKKVQEKTERMVRMEREMEERMRREHEGVEEERVEVERRREELRREVEAWEATMETVSSKSVDSVGKRKFGFGTIGRIKFGGKT